MVEENEVRLPERFSFEDAKAVGAEAALLYTNDASEELDLFLRSGAEVVFPKLDDRARCSASLLDAPWTTGVGSLDRPASSPLV
jgi:hypothetical protein